MYICKLADEHITVHQDNGVQQNKLKELSNERKLRCIGCDDILVFRRCTKKNSHFAHLNTRTEACVFEEYYNGLPEIHKIAINDFYERFKGEIHTMVFPNLLDKHWTSLLLIFDERKVALEFALSKTSFQKIISLQTQYKEKGITSIFLFTDNEECFYHSSYRSGASEFFNKFHYILKYDLNNKQVIVERESKLIEFSTFLKTISLSELTISVDGKLNPTINVEFINWEKEQKKKAEDRKKYEEDIYLERYKKQKLDNQNSREKFEKVENPELFKANLKKVYLSWLHSILAGHKYFQNELANYMTRGEIFKETLQELMSELTDKELISICKRFIY